MGSEVIIFAGFFGSIFGVAYLFFSTRNKERLALIEKGADASIFTQGMKDGTPSWKIFVINIALLLMGVGVGIFIASFLHTNLGVVSEVAFPGTIFLMAGIGLISGLVLSKRMTSN